ncbi:hypothetical protein [Paragemmobacter ruber]|uniref:Uncharacterized protein n=1 Tax=Paragemmobacter ruber TaxID=1985673 RepID=A0ABW9Y426_9RHOB|nr:hypothetical protein [Rhodobacter ruber]NBE06974.1 hypothetical protein [Rhodobacter ruber]
MSKVRLTPDGLPPTNEPLRVAVRRLRWFKAAFLKHAEEMGAELGSRFEVDDTKLAAAFTRWLDAIELQRPADKSQRRAFFEFAAALMMRELTVDMPLKAVGEPSRAQTGSAAAFWPEGYCCTLFCLSVHAAATAQEFHADTTIDPAIDDLRHWWSFKENTIRDASFSAGFLQMLLGSQPNWVMPDVFRAKPRG